MQYNELLYNIQIFSGNVRGSGIGGWF